MEAGDVVMAVYSPLRTDDLHPAAAALIGETLTFTAAWIVDEDIGSPYEGDWRMEFPREHRSAHPLMVWTPLCDLSEVVKIGEDPEWTWMRP